MTWKGAWLLVAPMLLAGCNDVFDLRAKRLVELETPELPSECEGIDFEDDPAHCGACGHDCLGGACLAGQCQPVVIAGGAKPNRIEVDESHVYFTDGGAWQVWKADKNGISQTMLAQSTVGPPAGIALQGDSVVYAVFHDSYETGVRRVAKDGSNPTNVSWDWFGPWDVVADPQGDGLFWINRWQADHIVTASPKGTDVLYSAPEAGGDALGIAVDEEYVYFSTYGHEVVGRVPKTGGDAVPLATARAIALAVDQESLYFSTGSAVGEQVAVWRIPKAGGDAVPLFTSELKVQHWIPDIAVADGQVFFVIFAGSQSSLRQVATSGGPVTVLAEGLSQSSGLVVDDAAVYVANQDGTVIKVAR
jgi:hypothetical protein